MDRENSWKPVYKWLAILGIWILFAFFFTSQSFLQQQLFPNPPSFWKILSWQLSSGMIWFCFMPVILWLIKRFPLDNENWWRNIPPHAVLSILISLCQLPGCFYFTETRLSSDRSVSVLLGRLQSFSDDKYPFLESVFTGSFRH